MTTAQKIDAEIRQLLGERAEEASICPSEVARRLAPEDESRWRQLMPAVREQARRMATDDIVRITRGAVVLDAEDLGRGPIRLRRGTRFGAPAAPEPKDR